MIAGISGLARPRAARFLTVLTLSTFLGTGVAAIAQETGDAETAPAAHATSLDAFSALPAIVERKYRSVRSLVVARGNCVVFEYYRKDIGVATRSPMYSVTKSVLSVLIGIAIDKGFLRLEQKLSALLPEASDANVNPLVRDITVRDLLTMTAGFDPIAGRASQIGVPSSEMWRWLLERPMDHKPGSHFDYDEAEQNLLSIALSRATKEDARRFAQHALFGPLNITDYSWPTDSDGYLMGSTSLSLTARDMAKISLLYLEHGRWGDKQIVSAEFVLDSTSRHNEGGPPSHAAYGYFWWVGKTKTDLDAFFAAGHNSQLIYVVPRLDLVVAVAAESIRGEA